MPSTLADLEIQVAAELCPATALERWLANEIAHSTWELDRVRTNQSHAAAEPRLLAAHARATRNWNRARVPQPKTASIPMLDYKIDFTPMEAL